MTLPNIDELIEKLNQHACNWGGSSKPLVQTLREASAALSTLQEQKRKLEEALKPFAKACNISTAEDSDCIDDTLAATKISWGDLRRARALLSGGGEG